MACDDHDHLLPSALSVQFSELLQRQAIEKRIKDYIRSIRDSEQDPNLRSSSIANLETYLQSFHHYEQGFKSWLYGMMNRTVAAKANKDLTDIWVDYQAASVEAKQFAFSLRCIDGLLTSVHLRARFRTRNDTPAVSGTQNRTPAVDFNTLRTSEGYLSRGRAAQPASAQPQYPSPAPSIFHYSSDGRNSAASSHHSQAESFRYDVPPMPAVPPPPQQQQTQYYGGDPFSRRPVDAQGQGAGVYYQGPGVSYPPHSGPWIGHGAQQRQGGPYYQ
ncbi:hypothetical protein B0H16DRAFT_1686572 [Mycena metata]|uniref:Uncharacterized protein n=1 Tax=Mycena metata TaxID=1033252 RepID=A0AAD7NN88_9AGAR|nr:hypothetical protein B0H16DRAFT_1686572 [Mycena metata]